MSESLPTAENDAPPYLRDEYEGICRAKRVYLDALCDLQASCDHATVLKYTNSDYLTTRVCEDCGYYERVQWDSGYKYKDQNLLGRAYEVSLDELHSAFPKVAGSDPDAARIIPPAKGDTDG